MTLSLPLKYREATHGIENKAKLLTVLSERGGADLAEDTNPLDLYVYRIKRMV